MIGGLAAGPMWERPAASGLGLPFIFVSAAVIINLVVIRTNSDDFALS